MRRVALVEVLLACSDAHSAVRGWVGGAPLPGLGVGATILCGALLYLPLILSVRPLSPWSMPDLQVNR